MISGEPQEIFLKKAIPEIAKFPIKEPYSFGTIEQNLLFQIAKSNNKALASWLANIRFGEPLNPLCLEGVNAFLKLRADFFLALLDLCNGIYYVAPEEIDYPAKAWFEAIEYQLNSAMRTSGLIGEIKLIKKRELFDSETQWINQFENGEVDFILKPQGVTLIRYTAQKLAGKDNYFNDCHWKKYLRAWRKYNRCMTFCKEVRYIYINQRGELVVTGRGQNMRTVSQEELKRFLLM